MNQGGSVRDEHAVHNNLSSLENPQHTNDSLGSMGDFYEKTLNAYQRDIK